MPDKKPGAETSPKEENTKSKGKALEKNVSKSSQKNVVIKDQRKEETNDDKKKKKEKVDSKTHKGAVGKDKKTPSKETPSVSVEVPTKKSRTGFARRFSRANKSSEPSSEPSKQRWNKVLTHIKAVGEVKKGAEKDPFLDRFTVTGRSFCEENTPQVHHFTDIFHAKFWRTVVVDPSGVMFYYWSMAIMVAVLYNLMIIILRCVFPQPHLPDIVPVWLCLDYLCDFLYFWDMFIKSRIGFLEQGLLVKDVKRLTKRYLSSWHFVLDIVCLMPLDVLYVIVGFTAILRLNRILKTWRLVEFFHMAETHTNFPNLIRVSNLVLYIIIIIHWNACFFFAISRAIGFGSDGWVYPDPTIPGNEMFWQQYLYSFYWSTLTLTTIGDTNLPESPVETFYCISCSLVGVLIFATIFGNVGAMINHMDAARTEFQNKVDNVKRYMELRGIGMELQGRVVKWFDYTWNNKQSIDDKEALMFLPEKLRAEISIHVHMHTLRRVAIFQDCEPGLLVELVLKLKLQVFSPGDYICKKGDIGKEMYIIKRGKLQVVSEDGKIVFVTLTDGAVFGEISVLNIAGNKTGNRRTASVKTVGYSDLFCLTKHDLWEALEEYPEAKRMLLEKGKQILRKDKLLDEEMARREERRQQAMVSKVEAIVDSVEDVQISINILTEKVDQLGGGVGGGGSYKAAKKSSSGGLITIDLSERRSLTPIEKPEHRQPSPIKEENEKETK